MGSRRQFLENITWAGVGSQFAAKLCHAAISKNYDSWQHIKKMFPRGDGDMVNLNSGSAGTMPLPVLREYLMLTRQFNNNGLYRMHGAYSESLESFYNDMAAFLDVSSNELALTKNTTESLNAIIWGFPLKTGDEVIISDSDYPYAVTAFEQRCKREGVRCKRLKLRPYEMTDEEIIDAYRSAVSPSTRLVLLTMVTHREGQVLPVKTLTEVIKEKGARVLVDGAHATGQFPVSISDIGCDFYASCMHKWMNGPHGTGLLYVRKDLQAMIHPPAFPYPESEEGTHRKFFYSGTIGFQKWAALPKVMAFNNAINLQDKADRLKYLSDYWQKRVSGMPGVRIISDPDRSVALAGFNIGGKAPESIREKLYRDYRINIKKTAYPGLPFYRVSTNIYMDESDLDRFVAAMNQITKA